MIDVTLLPDDDLTALLDAARAEHQKRWDLRQAYAAAPGLQAGYLESIGRGPGAPWQPVTGYENAYPLGHLVTHDGAEWTATRDDATGEPGRSDDWRKVTAPGAIPEWVQPQGYLGAYDPGAIVQHKGHVWRNDHVDGQGNGLPNAWEPGTTGAQWTDLGPVDEYNTKSEGDNQ